MSNAPAQVVYHGSRIMAEWRAEQAHERLREQADARWKADATERLLCAIFGTTPTWSTPTRSRGQAIPLTDTQRAIERLRGRGRRLAPLRSASQVLAIPQGTRPNAAERARSRAMGKYLAHGLDAHDLD